MDLKVNVYVWGDLSPEERRKLLSRSEEDIARVEEAVRPVVEAVRTEGDAALLRFTRQFDGVVLSPDRLRVTEEEFKAAEEALPEEIRESLDYVIENVERFHRTQVPEPSPMVEVRPGVMAGERATPVPSCGLYVPRGRGSFPSMVYMLAVPARLAGVPRVVMVTPPEKDGSVNPACLYAARRCGVHEVYRVGGAQAIAALAYGTESIAPVSMITGPGSAYVTAAKRLVAHVVHTGLPAGPSESVILADESADPWKVALDLLVEAEHGADSAALLVTPSRELAGQVEAHLLSCIPRLPSPRREFVQAVFSGYGGIILVDSIEEGAEVVNEWAPEHLQLRTSDLFATLKLIRNAGEILLGEHLPFSLANYATGPNAVLPTGRKAKVFSPVSVRDFLKFSSVIHVSEEGLAELGPHVVRLAEYEGFPAHAAAIVHRDTPGSYSPRG